MPRPRTPSSDSTTRCWMAARCGSASPRNVSRVAATTGVAVDTKVGDVPLSALGARSIARKHGGPVPTDTLDVAGLASVEVTSEEELYPVDHLFDGRNGAGGS